jgi:hypothetical protein
VAYPAGNPRRRPAFQANAAADRYGTVAVRVSSRPAGNSPTSGFALGDECGGDVCGAPYRCSQVPDRCDGRHRSVSRFWQRRPARGHMSDFVHALPVDIQEQQRLALRLQQRGRHSQTPSKSRVPQVPRGVSCSSVVLPSCLLLALSPVSPPLRTRLQRHRPSSSQRSPARRVTHARPSAGRRSASGAASFARAQRIASTAATASSAASKTPAATFTSPRTFGTPPGGPPAQLGHNPTVCLDTYAHVMAEQRGGEPISAEAEITTARTASFASFASSAATRGANLQLSFVGCD